MAQGWGKMHPSSLRQLALQRWASYFVIVFLLVGYVKLIVIFVYLNVRHFDKDVARFGNILNCDFVLAKSQQK
jgi:hypothetical protein